MVEFTVVDGFVASDVWRVFGDAATGLAERLLCAESLFEGLSVVRGVVSATDSSVLELGCWGVVSRVLFGGVECGFEVVESRGGVCSWVRLLDKPEGGRRVAEVEGVFGFSEGNIPSDLAWLLGTAASFLESISSGDWRVSQKSLEDVQVSLRSISSGDGDVWRGFINLVQPVLAGWSLCAAYRTNGGVLSVGRRVLDRPWWVGDSSIGVIGW